MHIHVKSDITHHGYFVKAIIDSEQNASSLGYNAIPHTIWNESEIAIFNRFIKGMGNLHMQDLKLNYAT